MVLFFHALNGFPDECCNKESKMNAKINQAIADCDRFIAKEQAQAADLRPADVAKMLDFYIAHRAKLIKMLEA
jgi:hypothetical protein